jgi:hypothetical protein
MDVEAAITLLTINLIVLSIVIVALIVATIVLVVKLNKIAANIQQTSAHVASVTEWFSPVKLFSEIARVVQTFKKR